MKKSRLKPIALLTLLILCVSMISFAEPAAAVTVTVNSAEGYSESGGNFVESNLTGFDGGKSKYAGAATAAAVFRPNVPETGSYRVSVYNINNSNAATQAEVAVNHSGGEYVMQYNQTTAPTGWVDAGVFEFSRGRDGSVTLRNSKAETLRVYGIKLEKVETDNTEIFEDISALSNKSEIEFLTKLNIITDVSGKNFRPDDNITRGEWAIWTAGIAGLKEKTDGKELFYDVPKTHRAFGAVAALYEMGAIEGLGNDSFRPDRPITELEGLTMLLKVMGYGAKAQHEPYPEGYRQCAMQLKLGSGNELPLSREKAARVFYKALGCHLYGMQQGGSQIKYGQSDDTVLERFFDLKPVEGIVTDNGISSLYGKSEVGEGQIAIGARAYRYDEKSKYEYLGMRVRAYISAEEQDEVKYIAPHRSVESVSVPLKDLYAVDSGVIEYYSDNHSRKKIRFNDNAVLVYNGMAAASFDLKELLKEEIDSGTLTAVDNDGGGYDVLQITLYHTYVVHRVNKTTQQIFVKDSKDNSTVINADPDVLLDVSIKENGIRLDSVEPLREWDVISVAQSLDADGAVTIYRSSNVKNGTITRMNDDNIYIDDVKTQTCSVFLDKTGGARLGKPYSFGLDKDGRIAWIRDVQNMAENFGYLINYHHDDIMEKDTFRILGQNGEVQIYEAVQSWKFNEEKVKGASAANVLMDGSVTKQQLIRFTLDETGKLKTLETAKDNLSGDIDGSFTLDFKNVKGDEGYVRTGTYKTIAARYVIPSGMLLFVAPQRGMQTTDMTRYYVADDKSLIANTDYDFDGYNITENQEITVGVAYLAANSGLWARSPMMVVDEMVTVFDTEENETVYELAGYVNNVRTSLRLESLVVQGTYRTATGDAVSITDLKRGDIIQYSLGKSGVLRDKAFKLLFSLEKSGSDENMVSSKDTVRAKSIYGEMYYAYGRVIKTLANGIIFNTDAGYERLITLSADTPVLLVENKRGELRIAESAVSEISVTDNVFVTAVNTNTQMVVIYR